MGTRYPTIRNHVYCDLLYAINNEQVYALELEGRTGRDHSNITKQLRLLRREGFVFLDEHPRERNKKMYSINWEKINSEFILSFEAKKRETIRLLIKAYGKHNLKNVLIELENSNPIFRGRAHEAVPFLLKRLNYQYSKKTVKNKFLTGVFKESFVEIFKHKEKQPTPTLAEHFDYLFRYGAVQFNFVNNRFRNKLNYDDEERFSKKDLDHGEFMFLMLECAVYSQPLVLLTSSDRAYTKVLEEKFKATR